MMKCMENTIRKEPIDIGRPMQSRRRPSNSGMQSGEGTKLPRKLWPHRGRGGVKVSQNEISEAREAKTIKNVKQSRTGLIAYYST